MGRMLINQLSEVLLETGFSVNSKEESSGSNRITINLGLAVLCGWRGTRDQTFKPFPLSHHADISDFDSSPILGSCTDKTNR
jgi:hypothetical protein